ncbi:MAG: thioredoxin domain-containing protein [Gammaproteobacteria bacterium]|nr:thioredoxin domain-containing protein [Gammaproteobacteria bacterium]
MVEGSVGATLIRPPGRAVLTRPSGRAVGRIGGATVRCFLQVGTPAARWTLASLALLATIGCKPAGNGAAYVNDANFRHEVFESDLPVLVDFTATWCVPCREVDPIVDELASEMAGKAKVVKLDIDDSPEIYQALRVNGVPTVIFFNEGREEDRIGSPQKREIYERYLITMIEGGDMLDTRLAMLEQDEYRQHFIISRELADIEAMLPHRPDLLVKPFADGGTPLSAAIKRSSVRQKALIELILSHDPDISLHDLLGIGRCDEFLVAVEPDYDVANEPDPDGATPLWLGLMGSVRERDDHCARALLEAGAQPISSSTYYLPRAVMFYEDPELLREFLDYGMDPGETDEQGMNALHLATMYGYYPLVEVLLEFGMDPATANGNGETAVEMVRSQQQRREELWNERGMLDTPEQKAAFREYKDESNRVLALLEDAQT